jgi:hypothetical protein
MAPNNFDKNIQQKFNSRKIEPSAQAWDRLDTMLTVAETKKQPKSFSWLKIAATFLVFSGMSYVFFQQNQKTETVQPTNDVVITKETPNSNSNKNGALSGVEVQYENTTSRELAIATPKHTNSTTQKVSKVNDNSKQKSKLETYLAAVEKQNENNLIVQVEHKTISNSVSAEALLAEAQGKIAEKNKTNEYKSKTKINANNLLSSVESELNQSFKEKALAKFNQAKAAYVNRNLE